MSPLQLHLFIDACTMTGTVSEYPNNNHMPVHQELMNNLEESGLVSTIGGPFEDRRYTPTEKGMAYLQFLCNLPLPVVTWKIPGLDRE